VGRLFDSYHDCLIGRNNHFAALASDQPAVEVSFASLMDHGLFHALITYNLSELAGTARSTSYAPGKRAGRVFFLNAD
jgi:hypothetical protein